MKLSSIVLFATIFSVSAAQAGEIQVRCFSKQTGTIVSGSLNDASAELSVHEGSVALSITETGTEYSFSRYLRKKEAKYSFASFVADADASRNFTFSLPKTVLSGEQSGPFAAFFTIAIDDGDHMVHGDADKLDCVTK